MLIRANLCLTDINKAKIYTSDKTNKKYLSIELRESKNAPDQFGNDGSVSHASTKEERDRNDKPDYCGSWKWVFRPEGMERKSAAPSTGGPPAGAPSEASPDDDSLPF